MTKTETRRAIEGLNAVIDLSQHNQNLDFWSIPVGGETLGIINKAAQGVGYVDPTQQSHKANALASGRLRAPIILRTASNGIQQGSPLPFFRAQCACEISNTPARDE